MVKKNRNERTYTVGRKEGKQKRKGKSVASWNE
jgi:hypothetical protein